MSWHQARPVLVELVSPAVICFSLMKWYFEPHRTVKGWRGEEGMLCYPLSPLSPAGLPNTCLFSISLSLSSTTYASDEAPPVSGRSLRHLSHSLRRLRAKKNHCKGQKKEKKAPSFCQGHPVSSWGFSPFFSQKNEKKKRNLSWCQTTL